MFRVLVLGNVREEGLAILRPFADLVILPEPARREDILGAIGSVDAILHKIGRIDREAVARQTRLRIIARHGVGLDDLDLEAIAEQGIPVSITPDANSNAVAEATVGLLFSALRHLGRAEAMIKRDRRWARESLMGRELRGRTVGIIGFGRIGRLVARYLAAFGCTIIVHDQNPGVAAACEHRLVGFDELMAGADIISLHCPLVAATRHLVDRRALALVRPGAILLNTSRGALIDSVALAEAAREGRIGGAALDVFDREPPDFDDAIFGLDTIITTPHVAAMTVEAQTAMATGAAGEIRRVLLEGLAPTNDVLGVR
ncbi:MAG: hydroxyacid dehydrogenase [Rhodobacteraceae bacterium]|nr:hydroxyacid dehydrogenase [Paracoccaceae bacterium]